MMNMGFMIPGIGMFSGVFLVVIILGGVFWGVKYLRRRKRGGNKRIVGSESLPPQVHSSTIQKKIMQLAGDNGGELTVTDVVLATDLSIKQAESTLNEMVDGFRIKMDVKDSGIILYEFSEIANKKNKT
jgi:hypothetical protein